jgi:virulence-associated protein VapD
MLIAELETPLVDPAVRPYSGLMYAIAFDLDTASMEAAYPGDSWRNGYKEVKAILAEHGFGWQQGSVYYGNNDVTVISAVLAAQALSRRLSWFKASVKDIRMLQLLAHDDLSPLL